MHFEDTSFLRSISVHTIAYFQFTSHTHILFYWRRESLKIHADCWKNLLILYLRDENYEVTILNGGTHVWRNGPVPFTIWIVSSNLSVSNVNISGRCEFYDSPSIFCVALSFPYLYRWYIGLCSSLSDLNFVALISRPLSWCWLIRRFHWNNSTNV